MGAPFQSEFAQDDLPFEEPVPQIWTRRSKEPGRAWSAFVVYRDLPPSARTLLAAYKSWYEVQFPGSLSGSNIPGQWILWKQRWAWDLRVTAFDNANQSAADAIARRRHIEFLNRTRDRYYVNAEKKIKTLERTRDIVTQLLEAPLGRLRQITPGENGALTERLVDTLKQYSILSGEARELETDLFAEVLNAVHLRPEDMDTQATVQLRSALFEWAQDPPAPAPPAPSSAASPSAPNAAV